MSTEYFDARADTYRRRFEQGLRYDDFVAAAKPEDRQRWVDGLARTRLTDAQRALVAGFTRRMNVLVLAATWCGDCMWSVPILRRVEEASPLVTLRLVDRDSVPDLRDSVRMAGAAKIPVAIFLSEEFYECSRYGERSLSTYRAIARLLLDHAPIAQLFDEPHRQAATAEWVNEAERVHWMLRLAPQLREKYQD